MAKRRFLIRDIEPIAEVTAAVKQTASSDPTARIRMIKEGELPIMALVSQIDRWKADGWSIEE